MKKVLIAVLFLGVLIVFGTSSGVQEEGLASTLGVRMNDANYCNDYFFVVSQVDPNLYELNGYEYGCGYVDRVATGSVHLAGGIAYFGWTATLPNFDNGQIGVFNVPITLSSKSGSGMYMYIYNNGGVLSSHGGTGQPYSIKIGSDPLPAPGVSREVDNSLR